MNLQPRRRAGRVGRIWLAVALTAAVATITTARAAPQTYVNWGTYMFDPTHSSLNPAATAITPATAPNLTAAWSSPFCSACGIFGSPTVYNGSVYIGAVGNFYRLSETTGAVLNVAHLGSETSCLMPNGNIGFTGTATVAPDPSRSGAPTVYIASVSPSGGNGGISLWALDANTLAKVWVTDPVIVDQQPGSFPWSAPTVSGGQISVGISSSCDDPLVRGGLGVFSQTNGSAVGYYYAVPSGSVGGGIWSSAAAVGTAKWVTTGNADPSPLAVVGDSFSFVRLSGATKTDAWTAPNLKGTDNDFGASPTLFTGNVGGIRVPLVGACNKNGVFYALRQNNLAAGPVWQYQIGNDDGDCISGAVWDAAHSQLIIGGNHTKAAIAGLQWGGSIRALSPDASANHRVLWAMGLPCPVLGTPTEDGAGVIAVTTWFVNCNPTTPALYLFSALSTTPTLSGVPAPVLLKTIPLSNGAFGQPTFADGYLFVASTSGGLMAYH